MRRFRLHIAGPLALALVGAAWWLWPAPPERALPAALPADTFDADVVATAGARAVHAGEVERAFALAPAWRRGQRRAEAYRSQLDQAIAEKLLAQEAYALGLDTLADVAPYLAFLEDKEVTRELYRREVLAAVELSDEAVAEAYARSKRRVRLHYVRSASAARAAAYAERARAGGPDAGGLGAVEVAAHDQKGTTDWLGFGEVAEELEGVVFQLAPGEVAGPVAVAGDHYVVALAEGEVDRFLSEYDFAQRQRGIRRTLTERAARPLAARYVADVMEGRRVRLDREGFAALGAAFLRVLPELGPGTALTPEVALRIAEEMPLTGGETVVTYDGGSMTAREVVEGLAHLPTSPLRPGRPLAPQLKDAVAVLVRNRHLAARGRALGLDTLPHVRREVEIQRDAYLARVLRRLQRDRIAVTPEEVEAFRASATYEAANRRAGGALDGDGLLGLIKDFRAAAWEVEEVERLRGAYPVAVDEDLLRAKVRRPGELLDYDPAPIVVREVFH